MQKDEEKFLQKVRTGMVQALWQRYLHSTTYAQKIVSSLPSTSQLVLDHFAVIDLPSPRGGIKRLSQIFTALGFETRGQGYLPEKQNDFSWLAEANANEKAAENVSPQIVVADFRLEELSPPVRKIIEKYSEQRSLESFDKITSEAVFIKFIDHYLSGRDWPLPSVREFEIVHEANELLAWVLVFGRQINHFGISIHLMQEFKSLEQFNYFVGHDLNLPLNTKGITIKGSLADGIEQSSLEGEITTIQLSDGVVNLPGPFVEFVWRFSKDHIATPVRWGGYFTDFVDYNANRVIESVYV